MLSKHSSKNQVGVLVTLFKEYSIYSNIGYFIADNTELNNMYINTVF